MEREEAIKKVRQMSLPKETMEILEALAPELKESKDERIRKFLVDYFTSYKIGNVTTKLNGYRIDDIIAYLEKQKEQKLHLTVSGKKVYKICPRCKSRMIRDDSKVYTSMPPQYGYECPKCGEMEFDTVKYDNPEMEEQKPAEWSENDTVFLNEITDFFENKTVRLQHDLDMYAHWLKSLPERFVLQPKQEWSEEDEKMRLDTIRAFYLAYPYALESENPRKKNIDWLKSLRPVSKESLQSHWKPREEQN